jgi:hypothetical protein
MIARETQEYAWGLGNGAGEVSRCFGCGSAARYFGISVREERKTGAKRLVLSLSPKHRNTETPKHRNTETPNFPELMVFSLGIPGAAKLLYKMP